MALHEPRDEPGKADVAVVVGGGSGIGRALALECARRGYVVVVADIRAEAAREVLQRSGGRGLARGVDVTDPGALAHLASVVFEEFGRTNLLVNTAGVVRHGKALELSDDEWRWIFEVNFWGIYRSVRAFAPLMGSQPGPRLILNTSSLAGVATSPFATSAYHASKYAVTGLSLMLREELGVDSISVSTLCPGTVPTNLGKSHEVRPARFGGPLDGSGQPERASSHPQDVIPWAGEARSAEDLAPGILDATHAGRRLIFTHPENRSVVEQYAAGVLADFG